MTSNEVYKRRVWVVTYVRDFERFGFVTKKLRGVYTLGSFWRIGSQLHSHSTGVFLEGHMGWIYLSALNTKGAEIDKGNSGKQNHKT